MGRETRFLRVLGLVTRNIGRNRVSEVLLQSAEADFVCVGAVSTAVCISRRSVKFGLSDEKYTQKPGF